jgi:O-methyltransferase involved in polyketide biosynthesis
MAARRPVAARLMLTLGATAQYTAACRAIESERADALLVDAYARPFAAETGFALVDEIARLLPSPLADARLLLASYVALRTLFFDDLIAASVSRGVRQVVLCAVGGDARSRRLPLPADCTVFEIDLPDVIEFRAAAFSVVDKETGPSSCAGCGAGAGAAPAAARCAVRVVPADFRQANWVDALLAASYDPKEPSCWVLEGLLMYLPSGDAVEAFVSSVRRLMSNGSDIGLDTLTDEHLNSEMTQKLRETWSAHAAAPTAACSVPELLLARTGFSDVQVLEFGQTAQLDRGRVPAENKELFLQKFPRGGPVGLPRNLLVQARCGQTGADGSNP